MNDLVKQQIYSLKYSTVDYIDNIQKFHIPSLLNFIKLSQVRTYTFEGNYYGIYNDHTRFYLINNLLVGKSTGKESCYIDSFTNLIRDGLIMPFLLFIDNKLIKWSNMTIVKDYNYTFLVVDGKFNNPDSYNTILLPCKVKYGEDSLINYNINTALYFADDGKLSYDFPISTRIELIDDAILMSKTLINIDDSTKFTVDFGNVDSVITSNNFIVFKNGLLDPTGMNSIKSLGINLFEYKGDINNEDEILIICFYSSNFRAKNLLSDNKINTEAVLNHMIDNKKHPYLDKITSNFSFRFEKDNKDENLSDAINYISYYDQRLLIDVYNKTSKTKSVYFTGKYLKDIAKNNKVNMSRRNPENHNIGGIMIFNNESLYQFHESLEIDLNTFSFYINDTIKDDDKIEILYFFNIENPSFTVNIQKGIPIELNYDISDVEFYSHNEKDSVAYKIEYSYECSNEGYIISLSDECYYGKNIIAVSKNQYHHLAEVAERNKVHIELSEEFRFCTNKNNYLVFINGQKIPTTMIHIVTPSIEESRDVFTIFTNIPIMKDDKVNVFYVPEYESKLEISELDNGMIDVSGNLGFNLDSHLYTFYINGRKLHPDFFSVIGKNKLRVSKNLGSIRNIEIYQYFKPIEDIYSLRNNKDLFDKASELFTDIELNELFGVPELLEDNEDITKEGTTNKALNYELVNSFNRRPELNMVNSNGEFEYTITDIISDESSDRIIEEYKVDNEGNYIIDLSFAILEDKAPIYERKDGIPNYNY